MFYRYLSDHILKVTASHSITNYESLSENTSKYAKLCLEASDVLVDKMLKKLE